MILLVKLAPKQPVKSLKFCYKVTSAPIWFSYILQYMNF